MPLRTSPSTRVLPTTGHRNRAPGFSLSSLPPDLWELDMPIQCPQSFEEDLGFAILVLFCVCKHSNTVPIVLDSIRSSFTRAFTIVMVKLLF